MYVLSLYNAADLLTANKPILQHGPRCNQQGIVPYTNPLPHILTLRTRQRLLLHRLLKHLQGESWLIIRDLVARAKYPQEAQVVDRLKCASLRTINRVGCQRLGRKGRGAGVGDCVCRRETAEPVADPVGVAGPQDDTNAALDDGGQGGEEVSSVCVGRRKG